MVKVLFVCMGNICRSPTGQGVFEYEVKQAGLSHSIQVDSAGTHSYHVGSEPDKRAQAAAAKRGIDISQQQARRVMESDFIEYDYILAMDESNFANLSDIALPDYKDRLYLFLDFAPSLAESEVPDPYYGGTQGFERVLDLIEEAAKGLLTEIKQKHKL